MKSYYTYGPRDGFKKSENYGYISSDDNIATQRQHLKMEEMVGNIQTTLLTFGTADVQELRKLASPPPAKDVPKAKDVPQAKDVPPAKNNDQGGDNK